LLNNTEVSTSLPSGELVLDFVRYHKNLTGTKIGCREGDCGACTVLVGEIIDGELRYRSATSCLMPLGNAHGKHIVTVEGVNMEGLNPVQEAFAEEGGTQCGFCTPGFIVSLAGFCLSGKPATYENAVASVNGNICRCTGYKSIERAAGKIAAKMANNNGRSAIEFVTNENVLPPYFSNIKDRLFALKENSNGKTLSNGRFLGGGTDLYVQQHEQMVHSDITFLADNKELKGITVKGNDCIIGASATVTDLLESKLFGQFPKLYKYLKLVSSTQIRNMATIAGNFVNASPIGDLTIFFLALDAELTLTTAANIERKVLLRNFYKGYKSLDKASDEYIRSVRFRLPGSGSYFNFEKVSKRTHLDIASVNSAFHINVDKGIIIQAAISAGGVGPTPMYLQAASSAITGKAISSDTVSAAISAAQEEVSPISDARGTEAYKRLLLSQLIKAHFVELFPGITE
jgi:xanthine dehydrogenase small subunit